MPELQDGDEFDAWLLTTIEQCAPPGLARIARTEVDAGAILRLVIDHPAESSAVRARVRVVRQEGRNFWVPLLAWGAGRPPETQPR